MILSVETSNSQKGSWGGSREGAGRPKSSIVGSHVARPLLGDPMPTHITVRIRSEFQNLQSEGFYEVFEKAALRARRHGLRILHFGIYPQRIELLCEFKTNEELEKSFKSLNTSIAIYLKKQFKKNHERDHKGPVLLGRFQMKPIESREELKLALEEILWPLDWRQKNLNTYSSWMLIQRWQPLMGFAQPSPPASFTPQSLDTYRSRAMHITALPQFRLSKQALASSVDAEL
jgi:hypothetical protein